MARIGIYRKLNAKNMHAHMKLARLFSSLSVLVFPGLLLQASAAVFSLDDPLCTKTLTPEEVRGLKICIEHGATCAQYWPNQKDDLQKCDATAAWIRAAKTWPRTRRNEVFGAEWPSEAASGASSPEPAWKRLPRSGEPSVTPQFNIPNNASADPYAGTSSAITPEAAEKAGWGVGVLTSTLMAVGQIAQNMAAIENPETAAAAKEVLGVMGLGEYSASDEAIAAGRQAEIAAAEAREKLAQQAVKTATATSPASSVIPPAVVTTSKNPYEKSAPASTPSAPDASARVSLPQPTSSATPNNRRSGFTYDDTNHNHCLSIRATGRNSGSRMAYGHYQLTNNCGYPIYAQICTVNDNADGSPSDSWMRFQNGAPCPGGWGGGEFKAGETQNLRTWFEFRHIQFHAYICRKGWSVVNTQDQNIYLIGERSRCRIYR